MVHFVHYIVLFELLSRCYAFMPTVSIVLEQDFKGKPVVKAESLYALSSVTPHIRIEVSNNYDKFVLNNIECFYTDNPDIPFLNAKLEKNLDIYQTSGTAMKGMMRKWKCLITNHHNNETIDVEFNIKLVKYGEIYVNDEIISTTPSVEIRNTTTATGVYQYRNGEIVKVTCKKNKGIVMSLQFDDLISTRYQDVTKQTAYIKLTDQHDGLFIACKLKVKVVPNESTFVVQLNFSKILSSDKHLQFHVNDLKLVPKWIDNTSVLYQYEYYDGETLSIIRSMTNTAEEWKCEAEIDDTKQLGPALEQQNDFPNMTVTLHHTVRMKVPPLLKCIIGSYTAYLKLKPFPTTFYSAINGLSLAKTLYRYKQSKYEYNITYIHSENSTLSLTCNQINSAPHTMNCKWDFRDNEVDSVVTQETMMNKRIFKPREGCNNTVIKCICGNYSSTVFVEVAYYEHIEQTQAMISNTTSYTTESYDDQSGHLKSTYEDGLYQLLAYIGGTVAVVLLVIFMVVNIIKRNRRLEKEEELNINYENLPEHNTGAMATPPQWDDSIYSQPLTTPDENPYTVPYVEKNIENMYAKPQPKSKRGPTETLYAEIGTQGDPNYAAVGQGQGMYANSEQNRPAYGQILPKRLRDSKAAPQVLPKPLKSAEVLPKSERNKPDGKNYTNVFENPRYGNMESKTDYAEPAYCELNPYNQRK